MDCSRPQSKNPDRWVANCPDFSRNFCAELREAFFRWEPDLTESVKWNMLCFSGRKLVCGLSGCKKHTGITFFRGTELEDPTGLFSPAENATWIRSIRVTDPGSFPRNSLQKLLRAAMRLDADPDRAPLPPNKPREWPVPDFFAAALKNHPQAAAHFVRFAPTYRREYVVWLSTARREETRQKRLAQTLAALAAGKKWIDRKSV